MTETIKRKIRTGIAVRTGISRRLMLCVLLVLVLAVACICVFLVLASAKKARLYPPHQIAVKVCAYHLMGRIEKALSFSSDWPNKDKYIDALKTGRERYEHLEYKLGPMEIRENETFDEATLVVVPNLSMKLKNLSTDKILPSQGGPKIADTILEKIETAEGPRWYITGPGVQGYSEIESTWLTLPRKKVADSPTIILKKEDNSVIMQIIFNGKVTNKSIVYLE